MNKKIAIVILLVFALNCNSSIQAAELPQLNCFWSDTELFGRWTSSPGVWYYNMSGNTGFPLLSGIQNGILIWNNALGTSVSLSANNPNAPIKVYGGTASDLLNFNLFTSNNPYANINNIYTDYMGITSFDTSYSSKQYNKPTIGVVGEQIHTGACIFILDFTGSSYNHTYYNYIKTVSHELGHAMGWLGHPNVNYSGWVMRQGITEYINLSLHEAQHLGQIYPSSNWFVGY